MTLTSIYSLNQNNQFECVMEEFSLAPIMQNELDNQAAQGYYIVVETEGNETLPMHVKKQAD